VLSREKFPVNNLKNTGRISGKLSFLIIFDTYRDGIRLALICFEKTGNPYGISLAGAFRGKDFIIGGKKNGWL
jgi:hypothetical protein